MSANRVPSHETPSRSLISFPLLNHCRSINFPGSKNESTWIFQVVFPISQHRFIIIIYKLCTRSIWQLQYVSVFFIRKRSRTRKLCNWHAHLKNGWNVRNIFMTFEIGAAIANNELKTDSLVKLAGKKVILDNIWIPIMELLNSLHHMLRTKFSF